MRMTVQDPNKPQLYSAATANGIKVAACLEEIQEARARKGDTTPFDYEPHTVRIRHGESRMDFFKTINPNGKVPVLQSEGMNLWESGAILLYLAEQFDDLLPKEKFGRYECIKWLFWGSDTFSSEVKQFGFYYKVSHNRSLSLSFCFA
jgi:GST-like protein